MAISVHWGTGKLSGGVGAEPAFRGGSFGGGEEQAEGVWWW